MVVDVHDEQHVDPDLAEPVDPSSGEPSAEGEDTGSDGSDGATVPARRGPRRVRRILLVLLLVSAVFLGGSAVTWWRTDHDSSLQDAQTRDVVLLEARSDIEALNTLDYRHIPEGLTRWRAVSTGTLAKQLGTIDDQTQQALVAAAKVSTGRVVQAALTSLDPSAGTASGIATVEISVKDKSGNIQAKRDRFTVSLQRVHGRWLVSALDQLPVKLS